MAYQIARAARAAGATISVAGVAELPKAFEVDDLLFLFNIDRPFEAASALDRVHPDGRALLYPLHHPAAGVMKYLDRVRGPKRLLSRIAGGSPDRYETLVDTAKAARTRDLGRLRAAIGRRRVIDRLIKRCELLVTSPAELAEIEARYDTRARGAWLLPHPVTPYIGLAEANMPRYVLVPGRIELRKNQLAALQTLSAMGVRDRGYEVILAGGKGSDDAYFTATIDFALANGIIYVSQLPKTLFFPAVSGARLVINASFFEVTSLIDLYAIENGIPLVTTTHGYYTPATTLRQVDPLTWGPCPPPQLINAIDAMLAPDPVP
ncbi:hypothetical protein [Sphingomonas sp. CFBP 13720]|uniref:hypothetical protein n=1 Tax=Sphingomonas sp. CFBP 13720 TaxID=2775302 RepID=UPI00177BEB27|nr:hypothetical protein [Sphingomonas sp. CFBP 13720]MBD8679953.1 hypothetical protein [Sphingomonas sp. CFBP 13720]